jgi:hypothetical protein
MAFVMWKRCPLYRRNFKEDRLVNSAAKRILAGLIGIGLLAGGPVFAQRVYPTQTRGRIVAPKSYRVAQQPGSPYTNSGSVLMTEGPEANPRSSPGLAHAAPSSEGEVNSQPNELFPEIIPPGEPVASGGAEMPGIENGLWDGCEPGDCCSICGGGYCTPPLWYTEQAARILTRSRPRPQSLGNIEFPVINTTTGSFAGLGFLELDNTRSANYDVAPGYYATVGRYLGRDSQDRDDFLEFKYWGMNTWFDSFVVATDPETISIPIGQQTATFIAGRIVTPLVISQWALFSATQQTPEHPFGVGGFDFVQRQEFSLHTEMHNWELNLRLCPRGRPDQLVLHPNGRWRRECQPSAIMSYVVGLRYMTIGDGFLYHSEGTVTVNDVPYFASADNNVQTQNDLFGLQFGADMTFRRCKWNWGIRSKVGVYVNFSQCNQRIVNNVPADYPLSDVQFDADFQTREQQAAFIGEVGFQAEYKFRPNFSGRAAYDFMWITGVSLAPEQVEWVYVPVPKNNANGDIYAHGITLGLEWTW